MSNLSVLLSALDKWQTHADELRDLDAVLGDGDLGITVRDGARAVRQSLSDMDGETSISRLLVAAGRAFGNANPSTFAALVQGGLLAAAKSMRDRDTPFTTADLHTLLTRSAESIAERGGAVPGDKTVLDALLASIGALRPDTALDRDTFSQMAGAATAITDDLAQKPSSRGRAAWVGDRSVGHRDPGSVAYVRLLESLRDSFPADR